MPHAAVVGTSSAESHHCEGVEADAAIAEPLHHRKASDSTSDTNDGCDKKPATNQCCVRACASMRGDRSSPPTYAATVHGGPSPSCCAVGASGAATLLHQMALEHSNVSGLAIHRERQTALPSKPRRWRHKLASQKSIAALVAVCFGKQLP